ncbi:MAG TPA: ABC transporter ATP-binding protein [Sedimentibacter sp.]|jgi:oligopeptide/dipeptide ABC transporter ATP-binding protein|nr:ABC transporter ATP-binding protein [Sedimentibacter sp.]HOW23712.1 ABC transporter ATP-binding protein [Sedimentibacter sp.]HRC80595.1 ABC transporter ATP-binding protein [Sedimentibacter sp.]
MGKKLLEVKNLKTYFYSDGVIIKSVDDVSFYVNEGETLGIVGESGCGKSVACMSLVRLVETPPGKYECGEIIFKGEDLLKVSDARIRQIRGNDISFIFQEPMTSLNPVFKIGRQISEVLILHRGMSKEEANKESIRMLELVKIPNPERVVNDYPFALSGGMRQRVMIAMALACKPSLLIADEPTTNLDVTIQAQVLDLMNELKEKINTSIIFITHDLDVIAEMSDRVMVMYAGKVVEEASINEILKNPKHPYTVGLINSKPDMATEGTRLNAIPGNVPDLSNLPPGCPFHPRCDKAMDICKKIIPEEKLLYEGRHRISCWLYADEEEVHE